jgi:hypothetical protein
MIFEKKKKLPPRKITPREIVDIFILMINHMPMEKNAKRLSYLLSYEKIANHFGYKFSEVQNLIQEME